MMQNADGYIDNKNANACLIIVFFFKYTQRQSFQNYFKKHRNLKKKHTILWPIGYLLKKQLSQ